MELLDIEESSFGVYCFVLYYGQGYLFLLLIHSALPIYSRYHNYRVPVLYTLYTNAIPVAEYAIVCMHILQSHTKHPVWKQVPSYCNQFIIKHQQR